MIIDLITNKNLGYKDIKFLDSDYTLTKLDFNYLIHINNDLTLTIDNLSEGFYCFIFNKYSKIIAFNTLLPISTSLSNLEKVDVISLIATKNKLLLFPSINENIINNILNSLNITSDNVPSGVNHKYYTENLLEATFEERLPNTDYLNEGAINKFLRNDVEGVEYLPKELKNKYKLVKNKHINFLSSLKNIESFVKENIGTINTDLDNLNTIS